MLVLVVSPDERVADAVRRALGPGFDLVRAFDGLEALRRAADEKPDLVIVSEIAGNYGAFGLTRDLKMTALAPPVVVLLERPHDDWLARWAGADRWYVSPADPFALESAARELVGHPASSVPGI